ncbi:MAG: hypothetical protein WCK67_11880 [bacterium]
MTNLRLSQPQQNIAFQGGATKTAKVIGNTAALLIANAGGAIATAPKADICELGVNAGKIAASTCGKQQTQAATEKACKLYIKSANAGAPEGTSYKFLSYDQGAENCVMMKCVEKGKSAIQFIQNQAIALAEKSKQTFKNISTSK